MGHNGQVGAWPAHRQHSMPSSSAAVIKVSLQTRRFHGADGLTLTADVGGDATAPAVVLLHGGGQTRHSWGTAQQALLARGYHVINLDARGHGDSDWAPDGRYRLENFAADLSAVVATLPQAPALVGASMGGITALQAVGGDGLAATALVLVDVVPRIDPEGGARIAAFMRAHPDGFARLEDAADAVAAYYPERPRPKDPSGLMKNLRRREDGRLYWHWDPRFINQPRQVEPPAFAERLLDAARQVRIPSLLVRGLKSDIVNEAGVRELQSQLPGLEVLDIAGAGHMVAGDRNDAFNDGVLDFLARHHPPAPAGW